MMNQNDTFTSEALDNIEKAIEIQENAEQSQPVKTAQLGRYHYCAGTLYQGQQKYKEALKKFSQSRQILLSHPEYEELIKELDYQILVLTKKLEEDGDADIDGKKQVADSDEDSISTLLIIGAIATAIVGVATIAIVKLRDK